MASYDQNRSYPAAGSDGPNPIMLIVPAVAIIVAAFLFSRRANSNAVADAVEDLGKNAGKAAQQAQQSGGNASQRMLITMLINALENDAARRAVIMGLKLVRGRL